MARSRYSRVSPGPLSASARSAAAWLLAASPRDATFARERRSELTRSTPKNFCRFLTFMSTSDAGALMIACVGSPLSRHASVLAMTAIISAASSRRLIVDRKTLDATYPASTIGTTTMRNNPTSVRSSGARRTIGSSAPKRSSTSRRPPGVPSARTSPCRSEVAPRTTNRPTVSASARAAAERESLCVASTAMGSPMSVAERAAAPSAGWRTRSAMPSGKAIRIASK